LDQIDKGKVVGGSSLTLIYHKVGMFGADLGIADLGAFEIELSVDNPAGGFLFAPIFLTDSQWGVLKNRAK